MRVGDEITFEGMYGGWWWQRVLFRLGWGPEPPLRKFRVTYIGSDMIAYEPAYGG